MKPMTAVHMTDELCPEEIKLMLWPLAEYAGRKLVTVDGGIFTAYFHGILELAL